MTSVARSWHEFVDGLLINRDTGQMSITGFGISVAVLAGVLITPDIGAPSLLPKSCFIPSGPLFNEPSVPGSVGTLGVTP